MASPTSIKDLASNISIIGLRSALDSGQHFLRRVIWSLLLMTGGGISLFLVVQRVSVYLSKPISANVRLVDQSEITFPTVTVCALRVLGKLWIEQLSKTSNKTVDFMQFLSALGQFSFIEDNRDIPDVSFPFSNPEVKMFLDVTGRNLLQDCFFKNHYCREDMLAPSATDRFGCMTINSGGEGQLKHSIQGVGIGQSLNLYLWMNSSDTLSFSDGLRGHAVDGFQVMIHDEPYVYITRQDSILITPGSEVRVALKKSTITELNDESEATCLEDAGTPYYTRPWCLQECLAHVVHATCGCLIPGLQHVALYDIKYPTSRSKVGQVPMCSTSRQWLCNQLAIHNFYGNVTLQDSCQCLPPCRRNTYDERITTAPLISSTVHPGTVVGRLYMYFSSTTTTFIDQHLAYTFWSMMSDIGGALGLFVGSAIFTLVELLEMAILICGHVKERCRSL